MVSAPRALYLIVLCAIMLHLVRPLPAQSEALEVKITGQPPYEYALLRATELSLAQSPWQALQPASRVMQVRMPVLPDAWQEAWATALLQTPNEVCRKTSALPVHVSYVNLDEQPPAKLLVSNEPEKIPAPRVLCEGSVSPGAAGAIVVSPCQ